MVEGLCRGETLPAINAGGVLILVIRYNKDMEISRSAVDKIGKIIRTEEGGSEYEQAISRLDEWREAHGGILDQYYDRCVRLAEEIDAENIIVAQRLKRLPTILGKLKRFPTMQLSSMQDIAGIRIIVHDMTELIQVEKQIREWENLYKISDYIEHPKDSGYRGKHFVFKEGGMFIEVQLRTEFQHLWATSVETVDVFRGASLKEKNDGTYWQDFFCQTSSVFAIAEGTKPLSIHSGLSLREVCDLLQQNMWSHHIGSQITSFALTDPIVDNEGTKDAYYLVITLNFRKRAATVDGYQEDERQSAFQEYKNRENKNSANEQTVLVAVNQLKRIQETYPNYFMDLGDFLSFILYILERNGKEVYN